MKKYVYRKFKAILPALIFLVAYLVSFSLLENWQHSYYLVTSNVLDYMIPFLPIFIIPYLFWFIYMFGGFAYLLLFDERRLKHAYFYLFIGMTVCLILYAIFPTVQNLRVDLDTTKFFQRLISFIYSKDTCTNVCPSIHVYNSCMMCYVLNQTKFFKNYTAHRWLNYIICISICLSTMFVKQHAWLDVVFGLLLAWIVFFVGRYILRIESM